jgi:choline dehydrogenase
MFDYIIVGGGSAGCVLANRLTEDPHIKVLLIEAGGADQKEEIRIPAAFSKLFKSQFDWAYLTEVQPHLSNRRLYWPRGKVLGGTSSINAMIYSRASAYDHEAWRELGNEGWDYAQALRYYKKAENQERGASEYHGVGGPLNVADLRSINPLSKAFVEAGAAVGLPRNDDFNGPDQEGVGFFQVTQREGQRHSTADAYLKPVLGRPNLAVQMQAHAMRLLFVKARVVGVEHMMNGQRHQMLANKGVILCGGAINSPQLLMLSGIGPADHLKSVGLPVVVDLPGVGQNLQDHLLVALTYECTQPITLAGAQKLQHGLNYWLFKKGPLTSNIAEAGAFMKTESDLPAPDLEFLFAPTYYMNHGLSNPPGHGFTLGPVLERPRSLGSLTLRSSDPFEPPVIQPNYLAEEADLRALLDGVKLARQMARGTALKPFKGAEVWPGAQAQTDDALCEFIRNTAETCYHPIGTCRMGNDELAVVDARLRVYGIDGVWVVDASVIPTHFSGHTNAPVIMIAEKAADMIKEDAEHDSRPGWQYQDR